MKEVTRLSRALGVSMIAALLAACGGGGSSAPSVPARSASTSSSSSTAPQTSSSSVVTTQTQRDRDCEQQRVREDAHHHKVCIAHVLLISIDGMHAVDLQNFVAGHPHSALASLTEDGVTYTQAHTTGPSDSFPGLLALVTGGDPASTGVYYENSFDRTLYPPKSNCQGTWVQRCILTSRSISTPTRSMAAEASTPRS